MAQAEPVVRPNVSGWTVFLQVKLPWLGWKKQQWPGLKTWIKANDTDCDRKKVGNFQSCCYSNPKTMTYLECSWLPKAMAHTSQHWHVQSTDCQTEAIVGNKKAESKGVGMNSTWKDFDVNRVHVESVGMNCTLKDFDVNRVHGESMHRRNSLSAHQIATCLTHTHTHTSTCCRPKLWRECWGPFWKWGHWRCRTCVGCVRLLMLRGMVLCQYVSDK